MGAAWQYLWALFLDMSFDAEFGQTQNVSVEACGSRSAVAEALRFTMLQNMTAQCVETAVAKVDMLVDAAPMLGGLNFEGRAKPSDIVQCAIRCFGARRLAAIGKQVRPPPKKGSI